MGHRTPPPNPADHWATYRCEHRHGCPTITIFNLNNPQWTGPMMEAALLASGWTYRRGTRNYDDPRGWRCPQHPHDVVAAPGLEPGKPAV